MPNQTKNISENNARAAFYAADRECAIIRGIIEGIERGLNAVEAINRISLMDRYEERVTRDSIATVVSNLRRDHKAQQALLAEKTALMEKAWQEYANSLR